MPHVVDRMLLALAVWFAATPALACSCMAIAFESQIDEAETILVVRIVSVEDMAAARFPCPPTMSTRRGWCSTTRCARP